MKVKHYFGVVDVSFKKNCLISEFEFPSNIDLQACRNEKNSEGMGLPIMKYCWPPWFSF